MSYSWSDTIVSDFLSARKNQEEIFKSNSDFIQNQVVPISIPQTEPTEIRSQVNTAKTKMNSAIEQIKKSNQDLMTKHSAMKKYMENQYLKIDELKEEIDELKKSDSTAKAILELRDEQAKSLLNKDTSNFNSSKFYIDRPLSYQTSTFLLVLTILFGIIILLGGFYLMKGRFSQSTPTAFIGGAWKMLKNRG